MSAFLLDTNCISELVRPRPEPHVIEWIEAVEESLLYLSVLTIGEIRKGIAALPAGGRRTRLEAWLEVSLPSRFSGRILPIHARIADRWGVLAADAKRKGKALSIIDGLLAATAIDANLTLVTRNARDFTGVHVEILNPWRS